MLAGCQGPRGIGLNPIRARLGQRGCRACRLAGDADEVDFGRIGYPGGQALMRSDASVIVLSANGPRSARFFDLKYEHPDKRTPPNTATMTEQNTIALCRRKPDRSIMGVPFLA